MSLHRVVETIQVASGHLVDKVRALVHEGNVQRIIIRDEHGKTFLDVPFTLAAVGAVIAPFLTAVGTISALAAKFTIVVERKHSQEPVATRV